MNTFDRSDLLTTAEMAKFVARGFLQFDAIVPEAINTAALEHFAITHHVDFHRPKPDSGTPFGDLYPDSPIGEMLRLPRVAGILHSLLGPDPVYDHDWVHVREGGDLVDQHLHADAIVDPSLAFDVQMFWFPHEVAPGDGGTGFVPGSHFRVVNEADIARYQYLVGQRDFVGPAGSLLFFHQGVWHRGRAHHGAERRFMYKIRLNPSGSQCRHWNLDDFDERHNQPHDHTFATYDTESVAGTLRHPEQWHELATGRLEIVQRAKLWRYLSGDDRFDTDWYLSRMERRSRIQQSRGSVLHEDASSTGDGGGSGAAGADDG